MNLELLLREQLQVFFANIGMKRAALPKDGEGFFAWVKSLCFLHELTGVQMRNSA